MRPVLKTTREIHAQIVVPKKRVEVPLHKYLIEQSEETVKLTQDTQTDAILPPPPAAPYFSRKVGLDVASQVEVNKVRSCCRRNPVLLPPHIMLLQRTILTPAR